MHVSLVANRLNVMTGGSDLSLDLLARNLTDRGHDVRVFTLNTTAPNEIDSEVPYAVEPHPLGEGASRVELAQTLYRLFTDHEVETDLFHVFNPPFVSIGGLYRWRGGTTPVVGRLNNYTIFCTNTSEMDGECHKNCSLSDKFKHDPRNLPAKIARSPTYLTRSTVEPALINCVDRLFAISPAIRNIYNMNGLNTEFVDVVPNFYDPNFTTKLHDGNAHTNGSTSGEVAEQAMGTDSVCRLLYVGRLVQTKGLDLLIDAFVQLDQTDVVLDVVGDGDLRDELESKVAAAGIADRVCFHGWVDYNALSEYYHAASVFVHPGRWPEPFGRTIIESMQCGCVPVVTDVGAPPWIVDDAGVVVPTDDPDALAATLSDLLANPEKRNQIETRIDTRVERFAPTQILNKVERTYENLRG